MNLESLVEDIYVAAVRPALWPTVLQRIAVLTGSRDCVFETFRVVSGKLQLESQSAGRIDDRILARYAEIVDELGDPRVAHAIRQPLGTIIQDLDFISEREMGLHPYYQDWLGPMDFRYSAIIVGTREQTRRHDEYSGIGLQRSKRQGPLEGSALALYRLVAPHVVRSLRVARRLVPGTTLPEASSRPNFQAHFTVDSQGHVLEMNEAAEALVRRGSVRLARGRRLLIVEPRLRSVVAAALRAGREPVPDAPLEGRVLGKATTFCFAVVPMPGQGPLQKTLGSASAAFELWLWEEPADARPSPLTPAEEQLVQRLEEGCPLKQAASDLGIAYETARSHAKNAMRKLGVRSQAGLVARWLRLQHRDGAGG